MNVNLTNCYVIEGSKDKVQKWSREFLKKNFRIESIKSTIDVLSVNSDDFKVSDAKKLISDIFITPKHKFKIVIFHNADNLNEFVQNALLKTLEEPPEYAVFIFEVKNKLSLLETVLSRSTHYFIGFDEEVPNVEYEKYLNTAKNKDFTLCDMITGDYKNSRKELVHFLNDFYEYIVFKMDCDIKANKYKEIEFFIQITTFLNTAINQINANANIFACINALFLNIMEEYDDKYCRGSF